MVGEARRQGGYTALISVLIIGAAATAIGLALLTIGADAARSVLVSQQVKQTRSLASACGQEALQVIHDNPAYVGDNSVSLGQGSCTYSVALSSATTRTVTVSATVGQVKRKIQSTVTLGASTVTASAWTEVSDTYSATAYVQSNTFTASATATTIPQVFYGNVTAGNLIVAAVSWDTTSTPISLTCSDNKGDTFTTVNIWNDTTNAQALGICYAPNVVGGATTVTATFGASSTARSIAIAEYQGVATTSPVDVSVGVGGTAGTTTANGVTTGSATTTLNGDLIFGAAIDTAGTATITAGTGFTQRNFVNMKDLAIQDLQQSTAGSVASTQTFGTAHRYTAGMVAFKAATQ